MTRDDLRVAVKTSIKSYNNIAVQAGTGVGKTKVALEALHSIDGVKRVLIVVVERAHIDNWKEEIIKWNIQFEELNIICYASLKKYINTDWDGIIFDEAHHLESELRLDCLSKITSKYNIFLSATLKDSLLCTLSIIVGYIKPIKLSLQDAFDSGIIAKPKIFLIPLELDNTKSTEIITEEWGIKSKREVRLCTFKDRWTFFKNRNRIPNTTLKIYCTQKQKYDYISEQFEFYKNKYMCCGSEALKNKWLRCGMQRKTYLGSLKTQVAKQLINKLQNKRFICFCTNIAQADYLGGDNSVNSKKKDSLSTIKKFNNEEINSLFAVGMLQEGMNLTKIKAGIIVQLDGEERRFIQKLGRSLRSDSPEQYIIYFRNTRDEEFLNKALEGINKNYIKTIKI